MKLREDSLGPFGKWLQQKGYEYNIKTKKYFRPCFEKEYEVTALFDKFLIDKYEIKTKLEK